MTDIFVTRDGQVSCFRIPQPERSYMNPVPDLLDCGRAAVALSRDGNTGDFYAQVAFQRAVVWEGTVRAAPGQEDMLLLAARDAFWLAVSAEKLPGEVLEIEEGGSQLVLGYCNAPLLVGLPPLSEK